MGVVYLLHLDRPLGDRSKAHGTAQHYIGYAGRLSRRLWTHRQGRGARMLQVAAERGIGFRLARTWDDATRTTERQLKRIKNAPRMCPICKANRALNRQLDQLEP